MTSNRDIWKCGIGFVPTLLACFLVASAAADTVLRFSPSDPLVDLGATSSLSVHIDEPLEIRTIELFVRYDPEILTSTGGIHGQCFTEAGAFIFENWQETEPGSWYGYAIVMDALHWAVGPGELYVWSFTADACGPCPVVVDSVRLYAPDANPIAGVSLPSTTIGVCNLAGVEDTPTPGLVPVTLSPNPFNPRTVLRFDTMIEGPVRIEVFDGRGRSVATAWSGFANGGPMRVPWDARGRDGRPLGAGLYLFRLEGPRGLVGVARGMLVK